MSAEHPAGRVSRFDRWRIGLVVPSTNVVMERDLWRMAPEGTTIVTARMTYDRSLPPLERLEHQLAFVPRSVQDLTSAGVDVIVYGCTSGSFVHGRAWEDGYLAELEAIAGRPVVLTARALVTAARDAGMHRSAVVTPYRREVNDRLIAYIESWGFEVATLIELDGSPPERIPVAAVVAALGAAGRPDHDGFIVACTALRAWEAALAVGPAVGRPVVTSNQAAMRAALAHAKEVAADA